MRHRELQDFSYARPSPFEFAAVKEQPIHSKPSGSKKLGLVGVAQRKLHNSTQEEFSRYPLENGCTWQSSKQALMCWGLQKKNELRCLHHLIHELFAFR